MRKKYFGCLLDHKYDINSLEHGFESLKGKDRIVGKYLEQANEILPQDEQYSFYLVKFGRCRTGRETQGTSNNKSKLK